MSLWRRELVERLTPLRLKPDHEAEIVEERNAHRARRGTAGRLDLPGQSSIEVDRAKNDTEERQVGTESFRSPRSAVCQIAELLCATRRATSRRGASNRRVPCPSTTMKRIRASIRSNRTHGCRRRSPGCRSQCSSCSSARGAAGGGRCLHCVPRRALLHLSTHARCPSGEQPCPLCWQSRAAWLDPSKQNRDLLWPRVLLPRPRVSLFPHSAGSPASPASATEVP
jgi:hypothetical protein